jgi:hypothetical protein
MLKIMLSAVCVLVAASPAFAGITAANIAGRWQGPSYANEGGGPLTLDIVACGSGWCGIKVGANDACGGTALKVDGGAAEGDNVLFVGTLELAPGTEPYTVHTTLMPADEHSPMALQITGDTGGQFRLYRRSFPFEAHMARTQDAVCRVPQTISALP